MKKISFFLMAFLAVTAISCNKPATPEPGPDPDNNDGEKIEEPETPSYDGTFSQVVISPSSDGVAMMALVGTPDGKFAAGSNFMSGNPAVWDIENKDVVDIANISGDAFGISAKGTAVGQGRDVNAGEDSFNNYAFIGKGTNGSFLYYNPDVEEIYDEFWGETYTVPVEDGSAAYTINEEENLIAGFYYNGYSPRPCIWKTPFTAATDRINLPIPTNEELGFPIDGAEVRWMSADASVLCGFVVDDTASWPLVIWNRQADGTYVVDPVCAAFFHPYEWEPAEPVTVPYMMFHPCSISANGEWVALTVQEYSDEFDVPTTAARFNLKTKELVICENGDFEPGCISNDGTVVGSTMQSMWDPKPVHSYVWKAGEKSAIDVAEMVGSEAFDAYAETKMCYIAPDNSYALGYGIDENFNTTSFVLK